MPNDPDVRAAEAAAADPASPPQQPVDDTPPPGPDQAEALQKAQAELAAMRDAWLRARAEVENVRKQGQADLARAHKYAIEKFAEDLLPVRDALELALATGNATVAQLREGVELTLKALDSAFNRAQLAEVDPRGQKFDPHQHQAMTMIDSAEPANTVVQVMQKGYRLADRILRPALVVVAKGRDHDAAS